MHAHFVIWEVREVGVHAIFQLSVQLLLFSLGYNYWKDCHIHIFLHTNNTSGIIKYIHRNGDGSSHGNFFPSVQFLYNLLCIGGTLSPRL